MRNILVLVLFWLAAAAGAAAAPADSQDASPQTIWRLLDYIAVDYPGAVENGAIANEVEYAEMVEFAASVRTRLAGLPTGAATPALLTRADALIAAIGSKAASGEVAGTARALARELLAAYPVPVAPKAPPDLARGAALYAEHCAACHGATGNGDGPAARGLDPPAIAFTDAARAGERSLFALYQVIGQGLEGTAMASFDWLPTEDRWAVAFHTGRFAFPQAEAAEGKRLWEADAALRSLFPDLGALTQAMPAELAARIGEAEARAVTAYLRGRPEAVASAQDDRLSLARTRLSQALAAYRAGDRRAAVDLALSAYLDGVEPVEPLLALRDATLLQRIEEAMIALRGSIGRDAPLQEVEAQVTEVAALLDAAARSLAPVDAAQGATFVGALTIILREGLEALLIIVAMMAFLVRAERKELTPYVHAGWIAALAAGVLTWLAATYLITISGAGRELTEGIGALTAAVVLVSVGIWMHGKSSAAAWERYVRARMSRVLTRRSAWFLFLLAFVVVYREAFETILFYIALWSQGGAGEILLGAGSGILALSVVAWMLLRYSRRLPIAQFFLYSSILIAALAVILAGKGIAALQEAGWIDIGTLAHLPRIEILGLYPTWQGLAAQLLTLGVLAAGFWRHSASQAAPAPR